jgi:hypothetical protein
MADKKVDRSRRIPPTPSQKLTASLSDEGTFDMADTRHDKGRSALGDKFREREELWHREQTAHAREVASEAEEIRQPAEEVDSAGVPVGEGEGGAR